MKTLDGTPVAWFLSNLMLQEFADQIVLHPGYFIIGVVGTLVIALVTVGSQTMKAGNLNPIDALRVD